MEDKSLVNDNFRDSSQSPCTQDEILRVNNHLPYSTQGNYVDKFHGNSSSIVATPTLQCIPVKWQEGECSAQTLPDDCRCSMRSNAVLVPVVFEEGNLNRSIETIALTRCVPNCVPYTNTIRALQVCDSDSSLLSKKTKPDSLCKTSLSPGRKESLRRLQPGELHVGLLPPGLRYVASHQECNTTRASNCRTNEWRTTDSSKSKQDQTVSHGVHLVTQPNYSSNAHQPLVHKKDHASSGILLYQPSLSLHSAIKTPSEQDVLLGRGHRLNQHPGNVRFRSFVQEHQEEYQNTRLLEMKTSLTHMIVEMYKEPFVHRGGLVSPRFLRFRIELNSWEEVSDEVARLKVSQLLRRPTTVSTSRAVCASTATM